MNLNRMPLNGESPSTESRQEFCLALKAARERKSITLAEIATVTKVPASLFAALERSDLRRWPKGLFRRAFFRDYVRAIGLPVVEWCDEFVRLFPDDTCATVAKTAGVTTEAAPAEAVRLVFDTTWHGPHAPLLSRLLVAVLDAAIVVLTAAALTWVQQMSFAVATAIIAVTYFTLSTVLLGESPAHWIRVRRRRILESLINGTSAIAPAARRVGDTFSSVLGHTNTDTPDQPDESGGAWITDAQHVEPALSSRLRIRIKTYQ